MDSEFALPKLTCADQWPGSSPRASRTRRIVKMQKVAALLGLGWTDFKMSSLNRLNRTGTTSRPVKPIGAER